MVRLSRNAISLAISVFLLSGCGSLRLFSSPVPAPPLLPASVPAEPFWEKLAERRNALENLKGLARVQARTDKGRVALDDVVVIVRRAQALRLEGIGPFGQPLFLFVTDGESLALYMIRENRLVVGQASRRNLERLFGIGVSPRSLLRVLLGDIPLNQLPDDGELAFVESERLYLWEGTQAGPTPKYRVWFDPQELYPVRFEMEDGSGTVVMQVNYGDFKPQGAFLLPARIDVVEPATQRRATWHYTDVQLNTEVSADLFRVRPLPQTDIRVLTEDPV
jgi:outer membrane lipoprotein-sorting protein